MARRGELINSLEGGPLRAAGFLAAALACVAVLASVVWVAGYPTAWLRYGVLTPSVLALIFVSFVDRSWQRRFFDQFLLDRSSLVWLVPSLLLFGALAWLAMFLGYLLFQNSTDPGHPPAVNTVLLICMLSLGEEVGWRGYALPRLAGTVGWRWASFIVGVAWWLWHMPGWLLGFGAPTDISFLVFGLWVVSASYLFSYIYFRSGGSVWTAVILHASANVSFQIFPIMPGAAGGPETFHILAGLSLGSAILVAVLGRKVGGQYRA